MKPEDGSKKRIAEENNMGDDSESERDEKDEEFIFAAGQQSPWRESMYVITTEGSIKGIKI